MIYFYYYDNKDVNSVGSEFYEYFIEYEEYDYLTNKIN